MRGLLVKDFRLLRQRTRFFVILVLVAILMSISSADSTFMISYLTLVTALFSVSTVSYDEYDNCYCFLMTLPIDRKIYTREKYLFGAVLGIGAWLVGAVICGIGLFLHGQWEQFIPNLTGALIYIPMLLVMISLILPFQLKYGAERGRMVMLVVFAGVAVLIGVVIKASKSTGVAAVKLIAFLTSFSDREILLACFLLGLVITGISLGISTRIMEKKEL